MAYLDSDNVDELVADIKALADQTYAKPSDIPIPSDTIPNANTLNGDAGVSDLFSRSDHRHPNSLSNTYRKHYASLRGSTDEDIIEQILDDILLSISDPEGDIIVSAFREGAWSINGYCSIRYTSVVGIFYQGYDGTIYIAQKNGSTFSLIRKI